MQLAPSSGCLLWLLFGLVLAVCQAQEPIQIDDVPTTRSASGVVLVPNVGELHGVRGFKTIRNRPIDAYLGIHYAQVGSGLERFQQAKPRPYQGYIRANQVAPNCAQFPEQQRLREAEARGQNVDDCLTLNIYTPTGARNLPVLVFVHGEMLFDGSAEEAQPDYMLEHDVVLVSINYRLAPFGFLSALSEELPGNVALSDLHLALEWVQRNIRYFGGAPNQVTLAGQAGGATLVHALSLSPRTQHLFQQMILQSGTALNPYLLDERPLETLAKFAQLANCPNAGRNLGPIYECLRRLPTSQLVGIFEQLFEQNEPRGLSFLGGFKLVVGDHLGYLPEHPAALVASNNVTKPLIVGVTKDASAFILSRVYDQVQRLQSNNVSDYINVVLRHTAPPQQHKIWHDWALREIFTPDQLRYVNSHSVSQGLLELANLILYRAPVIYSIRFSHKKSPTYMFSFDYRGQYHRFGHLNNPLPFGVDASLSDDNIYLFPYPEETSKLNTKDKALSQVLVALWMSFVTDGVPSTTQNVWPKAASEYGPFLRLTNSEYFYNTLEEDQHFGEGINVPNLYAQHFNTTNSTPVVPTTTTTPTTTRSPYYTVVRQPQPPVNRQYPANEDYYGRALQQRSQQILREQQARLLKQREQNEQQRLLRAEEAIRQRQDERRREQWLREQQAIEQRQREQQAREQLQREQQQRERERARQLQREQQERERARAREQQPQSLDYGSPNYDDYLRRQQVQQREENRLKELREQEAREQQVREQQRREQLLREQEEREQQPPASEAGNSTYEDYVRQEQQREEERLRDEREREREQEAREQQEREQQRREQLEREQEEREQQSHASEAGNSTYEDYIRQQQEQQEREEQIVKEEEARAQEREQQRREQLQREREEQEQQPHQSESANFTNDDYVRQQQEQQQREEERLRDEREREQEAREQQEREQQRREQLEREQEEREQQSHASEAGNSTYEDYIRQQQEQQEREEQIVKEEEARALEREQQRREQLQREREEQEQQPHQSESANFTNDDYVRQQQEQQQREEERLKEEREQEAREQQEREQQKERERQQREQLQREQEERERQSHQPESGNPTYEDYLSQTEEEHQREQERLNEEAREQEEQQRQAQLQREQYDREETPQFIPHEQLMRAQQEREEAVRNQELRDQYAWEQHRREQLEQQ